MTEQLKTAIILCNCSGIIGERLDWQQVQAVLANHRSQPVVKADELACGYDNLAQLGDWLKGIAPDRVIVAACSPREHEATFRKLLLAADINPYFLQMVNIREQVAWVTVDPDLATLKVIRLLNGALERVQLHQPLTERRVPVRTDAVIVGAGPAGMQAAITLAKAGRKVSLVEQQPFIGGLPVRFEELFPDLDCGPCLLEPVMGELLNGPESELVTLYTMARLTEVKGGFGNWLVTLRQQPRQINPDLCIGCMLCTEACPARRSNQWNGSGELAAVASSFAGALPNLPHIDQNSCLRSLGEPCSACLDACPVEGALDFNEVVQEVTIEAGAIVVASGGVEIQELLDPFMTEIDVHTAYSFERLISMNGPTGGELLKADGTTPASLAIVHCAGSLDPEGTSYCSGICCRSAFKYAHLAAAKADGCRVTRLVREQVMPGVASARLFNHDQSNVVRYGGMADLGVGHGADGRVITVSSANEQVPADLIVLCRPLVPGEGTATLSHLLELAGDSAGYIAPLHPLASSCMSPVKGIYLAGSCRGPGDIREAFASGTAAAGLVLSELVEGRDLVVDPQVAAVDATLCAGCRTCLHVCPYKAISWHDQERVAEVSDILCRGCGTCVACCPAGAISGHGFTRAMLRAEIKGDLQ
jgi:heterodisulfide reductase subunit A